MKRRDFIRLVGTAAAWPLAARAQQMGPSPKIAKIGVLWHAGSADEEKVYLDVLTKAFSDLGYIEGKNVAFLHRFPAEQADRFRALARDLVDNKVDVIIATTQMGAIEVKQATSTIPTVFVIVPDPVGAGLVESLAHPGGNMTWLSIMFGGVPGKRLGLMKEAVPNLNRVALLIDPNDPISTSAITPYSNAANALGLVLRPVEVRAPDAIEQAFSAIAQDGFDAAFVTGSMLSNERARVGVSALASGMPTMSVIAEMVPYGMLMSYGQNVPDYLRKAVGYVDKILKGAKPADLPVEQPTRLKLVINLKAAKALGLTVPTSLIIAADEVIE
ncbi:ABC transporter substrate-binding protein [Bradyrhizobium sp. CB82]|uniref:ABC transporter substrate-binding protein n=1 Tax=Bradyrhizobium sp. CB82 TaxID=3039159 RepID=UPI0024B23B2D|nr:ABC transporter substrate-binding protein [Bradyrhizobium sp. CB82]WFU43582.1 ABC transporter substrate-binding protein [Bradyrhizobium sp. CB82]